MVTVLLDISTLYGQGYHLQDVPFNLIQESFKVAYFSLLAYQLSLFFTKISILVFYLRVFPARRERWLTWCTIIFVVIFSIPLLLGGILQCDAITGNPFIAASSVCFNAPPITKSSSVLHTVTDAWLIIMVIPVVRSLQIPRKQKWALMGLISLGGFVIMASIARMIALEGIRDDPDITWIIASYDIWSVLELCTGIICACAPTIRPLLHMTFPKFMASRPGSGTKRTTHATGRREPVIELGSQNLRNKISGPVPIERKDSRISDGSERKMVINQGVGSRNEEVVLPNSPISPLKRNPQ